MDTYMLNGVTEERILCMSKQERRWFDNIKKAFHASDEAALTGLAQDKCLPELCTAVDTAKTLQLSLQGQAHSVAKNKGRFVDFIHLEIPRAEKGGLAVPLKNSRTGKIQTYGLGDIVYEIRCMVHENENLNIAEGADYHILLDWGMDPRGPLGLVEDGRFICNGRWLWGRLREVLAKFITIIDSVETMRTKGVGGGTIRPPLGSISPRREK